MDGWVEGGLWRSVAALSTRSTALSSLLSSFQLLYCQVVEFHRCLACMSVTLPPSRSLLLLPSDV